MPLIELTSDLAAGAAKAASSDLKFHLSEVGVALFHEGVVTLRLFAGLGESRIEFRKALHGSRDLQPARR